MSEPLVWVYGDAMLDATVDRPAYRRSPEDMSVPVLPDAAGCPGVTYAAGGAANLAVNLAALGCRVVLHARAGGDPDGHKLAGLVRAAGVAFPPHGGGTTVKTRYLEGGRLVARVDRDADHKPLPPPAPADYPDDLAAVVLTDYGRGLVTADAASYWSVPARWKNKPRRPLVYADPKAGRADVWAGVAVDWLVANWVEACDLVARPVDEFDPSADEVAAALAVALLNRRGTYTSARAGNVVVKRGRYGATLCTPPLYTPDHVPPHAPREVFDVQGAGDTFLAALVAAHARGLVGATAVLYANTAAGLAVGRRGTAVVTRVEVAAALPPLAPVGVKDRAWAAEFSRVAAATGRPVVVTTGCFDLFGEHHARLVAWCRAAYPGTYIVVGINSDASVARLKGAGRPVRPLAGRASILAALAGVHAVVPFDEDDSVELLRALRPAALVKGGDRAGQDIPERALCPEWGMAVVLAPRFDAPSTSATIETIRAAPPPGPTPNPEVTCPLTTV